jgi:NAD(P)-dependent dehydrogenase (short-subunit alcohol dehydrogenase family)
MRIDLTGRTAIVTGSTAGIGLAIARGLVECGTTVVVSGRERAAVDRAIGMLTAMLARNRVAGTGVTVSAVLPGPTLSEGVESMLKTAADAAGQSMSDAAAAFVRENRPSSIIQRIATPEEVANMVSTGAWSTRSPDCAPLTQEGPDHTPA